MAAKSIINELYQRLRTAAPIYQTQADPSDGFLCTLTLPAVDCEFEALSTDRSFTGRGCSKKEAEHAAAIAGVELLTAEKVLRPDAPAGSHSRGTATASPSVSSATSGVSLPGVGSKRSKSNADPLDEDSAESLELRILEALTAAYPKPLNGAQLAKLCGHFKLKSKVNHLLYMKLKAQGLVELLDTATPAWRATGKASPVRQAAAATAQAPASAAAAGTDAAACSEGAAPTCAAQPDANGKSRTTCAAEAAGTGSAALLTNSRDTNEVPAGSEHAGEVSSAAGRSSLAPLAPKAAGAGAQQGVHSSAGGADAGDGGVGKQPKQNLPASPKVASQQVGSRGNSKGGPSMSPAASSSAALARPAVSGGGVRGSCSPVPAAVYSRRQLPQQQQQTQQQQQQQQPAGGLHSGVLYSSRIAAPAVGQSDIARHRRQHMQRPQQQQGGLLHTVLQPGAAWSPGMQRTQQRLQQLQSDAHAVAASAAAQQQQWQSQQQSIARSQELAPPMGAEALLMPQTLAAVAGLGLVDSAEAAMYLSSAAGSGLRRSSPGAVQAAQQHSVSQYTHSANSFGCAQSHSHCSQEQQPSLNHRGSQGYAHANLAGGLQQQASGRQAAAAAGQAGSFGQCREGFAASDSDEEISPAVLAAATEAASLEPAPFDAERLSGSTGSFQQQQQLQAQQQLRQQQQGAGGLHLLQHVDLLAAMHINEQLSAQHGQRQDVGPCAQDAVVPQSAMRARVGVGSSSRAPGEAGTKRKYPAYLSTDGQAAATADAAAAAGDGAQFAMAAGQAELAALDGAMQDIQEQQLQQELLASYQQQEQQPAADADLPDLHPQRRRRRSRQGEGFSGRGLGLAAAYGSDAAGRFRGSSPVDGEQSGSSDDMQEMEVPLQAAAATAVAPSSHQRMPGGHAAGAEQLGQQPQRQPGQQGWSGLWQQGDAARCPPAAPAGAGAVGVAAGVAAAAAWNGDGQGLGSQWPEPGTGSGGNPWQWQGRQFMGTAVAADSEGNGSCLSWPAAVTGNPCQQQQQQQGAFAGVRPQEQHKQQHQQYGCSGAFEGARPASPAPCMSGLSVGASAVFGGVYRGSLEPSQAGTAAAAGQEVTQPRPDAPHFASSQQQQQPLDLLQSEEQALQLLSRLALPPAGRSHSAAGAQAVPAVQPAADAAAGGQGAGAQDTAGAGVAGDCLTVAMAAAAAAAQAAAAVASAAGLVVAEPAAPAAVGSHQQQQAEGLPEGSADLMSAGAEAGTGQVVSTAAAAGPEPAVAAAGPGADRGLGQAGDSIAPAELQAEYERRVGAVRDLVQQLNEALQGLSSLQGHVGTKPPGGSNAQQP